MAVIAAVAVLVRVVMRMTVAVVIITFAIAREVHIKFNAINRTFLPAIGTEGVTAQLELPQFHLQRLELHSNINHCTQKHVAADAAEDVEVKGLHGE